MMNSPTIKRHSGFTLLEVLIALLVLAVGLLGLAALQAASLKTNHGAYQRTQATFLAYDMIDRIRANREQAISGSYDLAMTASAPTGSSSLADIDLADWMNNYVSVLLPAGDADVDCTTTASECVIIIQWDESRLGGTATSSGNISQFQFISQI